MTVGLSPHDGWAVGAASAGPQTFLGRLRAALRSVPADADRARRRSLADVSAVLDGARCTLVEDGWVQDTWYGERQPLLPHGARRAQHVPGACLVGAVVRATRRQDPAAGPGAAGPALDVLWDALQEARGLHGPGVAGRAAPREVRAARVRDLTRWNDRSGRTRDEVLALLDLAGSRAIMAAVAAR